MYNPQQTSDRKLRQEKEKAENKKMFLESRAEIGVYLAWKQLPRLEQTRIEKRWDNYYEKVRTSPSSKDFFKMREYWKAGNMGMVKEIVNKARKRLEGGKLQLTKPIETDPWEFSQGIYPKYEDICGKIRWINKQLTGVEDVEKIFNPSDY